MEDTKKFFEIFLASIQGSAAIAATRHDTQAPVLVRKAIEIAKEAMEQLKND